MRKKINIFSFFSGAGFLDLGFELSGFYDVVYVNEFHKAFNQIYQYSRKQMHIAEPKFGHHVEDITQIMGSDKFANLLANVDKSKSEALTGFIGGPPCPDFSVAGRNREVLDWVQKNNYVHITDLKTLDKYYKMHIIDYLLSPKGEMFTGIKASDDEELAKGIGAKNKQFDYSAFRKLIANMYFETLD